MTVKWKDRIQVDYTALGICESDTNILSEMRNIRAVGVTSAAKACDWTEG